MKKRIFCLLLILAFALASCSNGESSDTATTASDSVPPASENVTQGGTVDIPEDEDTEYIEGSDIDVNYGDAELLVARYTDGGINVKEIKGEVGGELVAKLSSLAQSGKKSAKISDEPFSFQHSEKCYAPTDTVWIKTTDGIYRIMPDGEVSKCSDYYSEGDVLETNDEFFAFVDDLWKYYPRNTLVCVYKDGNTETRRVFDADSSVVIELVSLNISPDGNGNSVTIKITSKTDKNDIIEAVPVFGKNEFGDAGEAEISLKAGIPSEVTLEFKGRADTAYSVNIILDDARLYIDVMP